MAPAVVAAAGEIPEPSLWRLRFPDAVEAVFQREYVELYHWQMMVGALLGLLGFLVSGVVDRLLLPDEALLRVWGIRYGVSVPFILALWLVIRSGRWRQQRQILLFLLSLVSCLSMLVMAWQLPLAINRPYVFSVVLVEIFAFCLLRLQFRLAVSCAALVALAHVGGWLWWGDGAWGSLVLEVYFVEGGALACLGACFFMEQGARRSFLQRTALRHKEQELLVANAALSRLAAADGLTGLANRRRFDQRLHEEWQRAQRDRSPLSLLMVDVDYFKLYNDHYGHQQGDECLRRLAGALARQARRPADLAARYGGEEFTLLLPETEAEGALEVAEQLRQEVLSLALPHAASKVAPTVTISVGVASLVPGPEVASDGLVAAADQALYAAKHAGRNRACLAASGAADNLTV